MKNLLQLLITLAVLAFVIRFAIENVNFGGNIAAGVGSATLNYTVNEPTKVVIRASAIGHAEPQGKIILDIQVNGKSCSRSAEAYRKPSTPSRLRAELRCPERRFTPDNEYRITAISRSVQADDAKVEVVVDKVN